MIRSASATTRNAATSRITPSTRSEKSRVEVFALDVARPVAIRKPERPPPPRIVDSWPRRGVPLAGEHPDPDVPVAEVLHQVDGMAEIATEAIEPPDDDHVSLPRCLEEGGEP